MLIVSEMRTQNIRELTKKEKFLRLNISSWVLSVMSGLISNAILGIYAFFLFLAILLFFYIVEFFDDDIVDIALMNLQMKTNVDIYYP